MAVLSSDLSLVGIVVNTSDNFSQVMSLLHVKNNVNAIMKQKRKCRDNKLGRKKSFISYNDRYSKK